jgi:hypothetical protein
MTRGFDLSQFKPVQFSWEDRCVIGALNLLVGEEGVGKGTLLAYLIAKLTTGTLPGAHEGEPVSVLWIGDEDGWHDAVGPRLFAAEADLKRVKELTHTRNRLFSVREDADHLEHVIAAGGFKVVVFEALLDNMPQQGRGGDPMQHVRSALAPTRAVFRRQGVTGLATLHTKKGTATSFRELQAGSHQYNALSRSSLLLAQDPDNKKRRLVVAGKQNHTRASVTVSFKLDESRFKLNGEHFKVPRGFDFRDEPNITLASLLDGKGKVADEVMERVREALSDEPQSRKTIRETSGYRDDSSFDRALKSLGKNVGRGKWKLRLVEDS